MTIFQRWKQTAIHNKALVLTGVIVALGAIGQFLIMWSNNRQTSAQISKLIAIAQEQSQAATDMAQAAGDQVDAANNFSDTAEEINGQTRKAVDQFARLAKATEQTVSNSQKAFRSEQRAWLGLQDFKLATYETGKIVIAMTVVNSGRTPARQVYSGDTINAKTQALNAPEPRMLAHEWLPGPAIPPQGKYELSIDIPKEVVNGFQATIMPRKYLYLIGDIDYELADGKKGATQYCLTISADSNPKKVDLCRFHNDME